GYVDPRGPVNLLARREARSRIFRRALFDYGPICRGLSSPTGEPRGPARSSLSRPRILSKRKESLGRSDFPADLITEQEGRRPQFAAKKARPAPRVRPARWGKTLHPDGRDRTKDSPRRSSSLKE